MNNLGNVNPLTVIYFPSPLSTTHEVTPRHFNRNEICIYVTGLLTIPFTLLGEMYPANARGLASGITLSIAFTLTFVVVKLYPSFIAAFGFNNLFLFFGVMSLLSMVYVYFLVPETKGKTLKEIGEMFRKNTLLEVKEGYLKVDIGK